MSAEILRKGGKVLVEIGWNQAEYVTFLLAQIGFTRVEVLKDYSNLPRAVIATWGQ